MLLLSRGDGPGEEAGAGRELVFLSELEGLRLVPRRRELHDGRRHPAGPQADGTCATCHQPQGDAEWDASVRGAHTVPDKSKQLKGLNAEIISVDQAAPGKKPVVTFKLTNGDGTILDPKTFGSNLNIDLGGPASDYTLFPVFRERADGATFNGTVGTYTFTKAIPANASGTWTFSIEARRAVTLNPAPVAGPATSTREQSTRSSTSRSPAGRPSRAARSSRSTSATSATTVSRASSPMADSESRSSCA